MCSVIKFVKLLLMLNEGDDKEEISTWNLLNELNIVRINIYKYVYIHTANQLLLST